MPKTICGKTVRELLDDYSGRDREIKNCTKYRNGKSCKICDEDHEEMEKIIVMIEMAI